MSVTTGPPGDTVAAKRAVSDPPPLGGRQGPATFLALIGVVWFVICVEVIVRWVTSGEEFTPAPRIGPDVMEDWRLVALRIFEAISLAVMAAFVWYCVVKPLRETRSLSLDGKFVIGGIICFVADASSMCSSIYSPGTARTSIAVSGFGFCRSTTRRRRAGMRSR